MGLIQHACKCHPMGNSELKLMGLSGSNDPSRLKMFWYCVPHENFIRQNQSLLPIALAICVFTLPSSPASTLEETERIITALILWSAERFPFVWSWGQSCVLLSVISRRDSPGTAMEIRSPQQR